jgi:hypothetical protein
VRGSLSGGYVRKTGDTMTGGLAIRTNTADPLTVDRPDGADYYAMIIQQGGASLANLTVFAAEPRVRMRTPAGVERLTLRMDTGLLGTGLIPLSMLQSGGSPAAGENAGAVTVLAAETAIATSNASAATAIGDLILVCAQVTMTKGVTAGITHIWVKALGSGTVTWLSSLATLDVQSLTAANDVITVLLMGLGLCSNANTQQWGVRGTSAGSNGTVAIAGGQIIQRVLRG